MYFTKTHGTMNFDPLLWVLVKNLQEFEDFFLNICKKTLQITVSKSKGMSLLTTYLPHVDISEGILTFTVLWENLHTFEISFITYHI